MRERTPYCRGHGLRKVEWSADKAPLTQKGQLNSHTAVASEPPTTRNQKPTTTAERGAIKNSRTLLIFRRPSFATRHTSQFPNKTKERRQLFGAARRPGGFPALGGQRISTVARMMKQEFYKCSGDTDLTLASELNTREQWRVGIPL